MRPFSLVGLLALSAAVPGGAQSALYRSFNLDGSWAADGGVVQFNFVHRFYVTPAPLRKVINYPTFTLALGLGRGLMVGTRYSSQSTIVPSEPNEAEPFFRWRILSGGESRPGVGLAATWAYNTAAQSFDGELAASYTRGPVTLGAAFRAMEKRFGRAPYQGDVALGAGVAVRLNDYVALSGDYATLLGIDTTAAWSAGVSLVIPGSPHTFSLHASRAATTTIQGASVGFPKVLYGFEFTIPLQLRRFAPWFGGGDRRGGEREGRTAAAAEVDIRGYRYQRDTVRVAAGQAVRWTNADPVEHTVTFDEPGPQSSHLLGRRDAFVVRFDRPGTYSYHCTPHPFMKGVVVVQ